MDCPPCREMGIKLWGRSHRACLYMDIHCRDFTARPGQCWKLPGCLCFWPDVKAQKIMLKQAVLLLLSSISSGHQLTLAKESWFNLACRWHTGMLGAASISVASLGVHFASLCLRLWFFSPGFSSDSHVKYL